MPSEVAKEARRARGGSSAKEPGESFSSILIGNCINFGMRLVPMIWLASLISLGFCLINRKNVILRGINQRENLVIGLDEIIKATRVAALRGCVRTSEYRKILQEYGIKSWPMPVAPGEVAVRVRGHLLQVQIGAGPKSDLKITMGDDGRWITEVEAIIGGETLALKAMLFPWGGK